VSGIDLIRYRSALRGLDDLPATVDRRCEKRYAPKGSLSKATVSLMAHPGLLDADVIELSPNGMRLAVAPGIRCKTGDRCLIEIQPTLQTCLKLQAEIRWVEEHPLITVFGVQFEQRDG
jgi:PilZ domain